MLKNILYTLLLTIGLGATSAQAAEQYTIDTKGMHAFITFRIQHLGFSWLEGRFNRFSGSFDYDESNPANNRVTLEIDIASLDSNHAERDKHLRSERFFDAGEFPKATFASTSWKDEGNGKAKLTGKFTLRGVTNEITLDVSEVGAGKDPWGGYRRGFVGTTTLKLSDYKMKEAHILGPNAEQIEIWVSIEGIRQ